MVERIVREREGGRSLRDISQGLDRETGTVVWPGGADLAPDTLYERVRTGAWPEPRVTA